MGPADAEDDFHVRRFRRRPAVDLWRGAGGRRPAHRDAALRKPPATKTEALDKLARYQIKIGYTSEWRDYSAVKISADDLYGDVLSAQRAEWAFELNHLGKPVDRKEWSMTPQTVNAYNNPTLNEVVFPAAILQPPFFDPKADPAINYGGIVAVIGHEMTHGFDDQGRKYDGTGKLRD